MQYFVAAPPIGDWSDLRGKTRRPRFRIGSCSYWFMREVLQSHGLDPDADVKHRSVSDERYPAVVELFQAGRARRCGALGAERLDRRRRGAFRVMQALTDAAFCPDMQWSVVVAGARHDRATSRS